MNCDQVKHCLFASPWFQPICMDSQFRSCSFLLFPPNNDMWSSLTVAFVLVDLTWSTFCVHIFRRQLQTNMAVRLCDVASLLRSGSWAPEPWTGVCGTFLLFISFGKKAYLTVGRGGLYEKPLSCYCLTLFVWFKIVCHCLLWHIYLIDYLVKN